MLDIENGNQTDEIEDIDSDDAWDLGEEGIEDTDDTEEPEEEATSEPSENDEELEEDAEEVEEESEEVEEDTTDVALEDLELNVLGNKVKLADIPRDELTADLQKGKDYDRVKGQRDTLQDDINDWTEISEMFNMTPNEVKETLREQKFNKIAEDEGRKVEDVKREYFSNKKSASDKMYSNFLDKYPDVNVDDLPQSVKDDVKIGKDITTSYEEHQRQQSNVEKDNRISELEAKINELESKVKVKKQNTKSKKKGVIKKTGTSTTKHDDFLDGFLDQREE